MIIKRFSFKKNNLKISSAKWLTSYVDHNGYNKTCRGPDIKQQLFVRATQNITDTLSAISNNKYISSDITFVSHTDFVRNFIMIQYDIVSYDTKHNADKTEHCARDKRW